MSQATLDTLELSKRLQKAGFSQEQADPLASVQREATDEIVKSRELATKQDIMRVEIKLNEMEPRMTRTLFNMLLGFAAAIGAFFGITVSFIK